MLTEIRCPKCGSDAFLAKLGGDDWARLACDCARCGNAWESPTLDAPPVSSQGRDVEESVWEIAEWDGRVWVTKYFRGVLRPARWRPSPFR